MLCDEFGALRSICRTPHAARRTSHAARRTPHEYQGQGSTMTIASLVVDMQNEVMHVAPGQPNQSEYQPVYLPGRSAPQAVKSVGIAAAGGM